MLSWTIALSFCTLLQIVEGSSHGLWSFNSGSLIHSPATFLPETQGGLHSLHGNGGREEVTGERDLRRQKRQAVSLDTSPVEYTIDIEIGFADSSLPNTVKSYLDNLSFPLLVNASDPNEKISSIQVTTVCNSTSINSTHCYCEDGYRWPSNPAAPEDQLPSQGTYCERLPEDTGEEYKMKMNVRLNIPFQNALTNSSSKLYELYKRDLECAFTVGYKTLRGFIRANVIQFRNGSTLVDYEVTSARAILVENASGKVAAALNSSYYLEPTSFRTSSVEILGGTNVSFSPEPIFKGDTVTMTCESRSKSSNVTWSHRGSSISNSSRHSIVSAPVDGKSVSTLKIRNILLNESGEYSCTFTEQDTSPTIIHTAEVNIAVSLIQIVKSEDIVMECNGAKRELSCCVDTDMGFFDVHWKLNGAINISGTNYSTYNCSHYVLQASESQCPADKSGTNTTYTCEISTADGARQSKHITVQYLSKGATSEYIIAVEIHFADSSLQNAIKSYLNNLSFPLLINVSDPTEKISSIQVTTVCNSSGINSTQCYCEDGYRWPNGVCTSPSVSEDQLPSQGTYCERLPEDTGEEYKMKMNVRLNIPFQNALTNSSSKLYERYKRDLECAFTVGYKTLRGFQSADVTNFRNGSTVVDYEVTSARAIPVEKASGKVATALNSSYNLEPTSFRTSSVEILGGTNISISPQLIFKGDTVVMKCESRSKSSNVTWLHRGSSISNSSRHSVVSAPADGKSVSTLKIRNILLNESGEYRCSFTEQDNSPTTIHIAEVNITVSLIQIMMSEDIVMVCNGSKRELSCCVDTDISIFDVHWKPNGAINISGTNYSTYNCSHYVLQASESQCPADKSGTNTTYTCEISTADGARQSKHITVQYLREGGTNISFSPKWIFKGDTVNMTCESRSKSSKVTWLHRGGSISNSSRHSVVSVHEDRMSVSTLTIRYILLNESGEYRCVFTEQDTSPTMIHTAEVNITVSLIQIVKSEDIVMECNGAKTELSCCVGTDIGFFDVHWKLNGAVNISGTNYSTYNCSHYVLQANESQCPADKSGTNTIYTCEISTADGARQSTHITVQYLRKANVTLVSSTNSQISDGYNFSLTCHSDVSNYDKISWEIQNENPRPNINNVWYTTTKTQTGAESVLVVPKANQNWSGTYICTFFQKFLNSSAHLSMEVVRLPLEQDIIRDPFEAVIPCPGNQVLKCCIDSRRMENYTVTFTVDKGPSHIQNDKRQEGNLVCYTGTLRYNKCDGAGQAFSASCEFQNRIGGRVQSSPMSLKLAPKNTIMCNSSDIGVGESKAEVVKPCLGSDSNVRGNITYRCEHTWVVAQNNCLSVPVNDLLNGAEDLLFGPAPVESLPAYLTKLNNTVKTEQKDLSNSSANLEAVVGILNMISVIPVKAEKEMMANFLSTVDTVISTPTDTWKAVTNGSSQLLDSVEQFSNSLIAVNDTIPSVNLENIQLQGVVLDKNNISDYNKNFIFSSLSNLSGNVLINETEIESKELFTIISVAYSNLSHIIPQHKQSNELINGLVISTVVKTNQSRPFQIQMTFAKMNKSLINPRCVFWNFSFSGDQGGWDDTGCKSENNDESVSCSCEHLTSFSVLMSPTGRGNHDESHWQALTYLTYVGVGISILSLVACVVIEAIVWKSVTKTRISYTRHICILNVVISLLIADIWFIVISAKENIKEEKELCTAAAFFVHFFYLCVFFWMLSLSLILFYHLVFILHNTSKTTMKAVAFCLGYGCPLVISTVTIAVTLPKNSYTRDDICFLSWDKSQRYVLLALVVPALIIVAINAVITIVVIMKIPIRSIGERSRNNERSSLYRIIKSFSILTPLLGLTWGFGLATVFARSSLVIHILFNVLNAFQGLFILLFGILWDRKVREALLNKCRPFRWSSQTSKTSVQGHSTAPMLSISSPFSRVLNNMFGKAGKYQVSSTESASSENTSKAYSLLT